MPSTHTPHGLYDQLESLCDRIRVIQHDYLGRVGLRRHTGYNDPFSHDTQYVHENIRAAFDEWEKWVRSLMNAQAPHGLAQPPEGVNRTPAEEAVGALTPHGRGDRP